LKISFSKSRPLARVSAWHRAWKSANSFFHTSCDEVLVTRLARRPLLSPHFFLAKSGKAISCDTLRASFQKLRRLAGTQRHDDAVYQLRMQDLRTTFAVHRLTSWLKQGADLNRLLLALAAYIGQVGLGSTEGISP
jgi:hypothetical protein